MSVDLVTGGAGFIGSHLVRRLVDLGREVRVADDLSTSDGSRLAELATRIDLRRIDLATDALGPLLEGVERIFHLAAVPSVPRSVRDPLLSHASIATATLRVPVAINSFAPLARPRQERAGRARRLRERYAKGTELVRGLV